MGAPAIPAAEQYLAAQVDNEPPHPPTRRDTVGGRTLWYQLKVIQQPERARACGSGPKSSADRRPVDPPPVVELRIFEGPTWEHARDKDITFLYNANFFLYATLEHARVLAQGRVSTGINPNTPPVLTGMPVSGMAYLDRPSEAGYFLFPDLSVRHEGRYRLVFHLYEETKEACDKSVPTEGEQAAANAFEGGSFDYRDEIRSIDFVVYSAKKFPGLTESTPLSKVVADQGCRVRIRRDVRMRRRDGKGSNATEFENNAEETFDRRRQAETPDNARDQYRGRSMSGSVERTPYSADAGRRPSMPEYAQQQYAQPPTPTSAQSHLGFMGGSSSTTYPARHSFAQPSSGSHSPTYPTPPNAYPQSSHPPPPQPSYPSERRPPPPPPAYVAPLPSPKAEHAPHDYARRMSQIPPLPPLQTTVPPPVPAITPNAPGLPSLVSLTEEMHARRPSFLGRPGPGPLDAKLMAPVPSIAGTKRGRDSFSRDELEAPRRQNGARDDGQVHDNTEGMDLIYNRAGGYQTSKPAPRMFP